MIKTTVKRRTNHPLKVSFVGNLWLGSDARSLKDSLVTQPGVHVDELDLDQFIIKGDTFSSRLLRKLTNRIQFSRLRHTLQERISQFEPHVVVVYKGNNISAETICDLKDRGIYTVCYFPDPHPWLYGSVLAEALGEYDLIVSAKSFHPHLWNETYGYRNPCIHVSHGYDPVLHYRATSSSATSFDIVLVAHWKLEYERLMQQVFSDKECAQLSYLIAGNGWSRHSRWTDLPRRAVLSPALFGQCYVDAVRSGTITLAPVWSEVKLQNSFVHGDLTTARTYQLAAANTFFLHRRTAEASLTYDEETEVPMWSEADELIEKIKAFVSQPTLRNRFIQNAHRRAVPSYSIAKGAEKIISELRFRLSR